MSSVRTECTYSRSRILHALTAAVTTATATTAATTATAAAAALRNDRSIGNDSIIGSTLLSSAGVFLCAH